MLVMILSVPLAIATYGSAFAFAGNFLLFLASASLLAGIGNISWSPLLYGIGATKTAFVATAVGTLMSIVVALLLVFSIGVYGILIGTVLGQLVSLLLASRFISAIIGKRFQTWITGRIYVSSALSALTVYPIVRLGLNPFLEIALGAVCYFLIIIPVMALTKALTRNDFEELRSQFKEVSVMARLLNFLGRYHEIFTN